MEKNKKVLLIGGAGFIGAHLCKVLASSGKEVAVLSKNNGKIRKLGLKGNINFVDGDITDYSVIEKNIKSQDWIINLASSVSHDANFDPYLDLYVNCKGQINILEARKKVNPNSRYIFIGSRTQFGIVGKKNLPIKEGHCQKPISLYGIHKQTAENYCSLYRRAFSLKSIILRLPQVYGPSLTNDKTYSIIDKFVKEALKNKELQVNGYGKDIKDFIYIGDVVDLIAKILNSNVVEGTFNAGSGKKVTLIDAAKRIVKLCGSGSYKAVPFPKDIEKFELGSFYFDISRVSRQFKWKPKVNLDKGIMMTLNHYKKSEKR